eukprot:6804562-Heterocapsa_arctica.AAC.1
MRSARGLGLPRSWSVGGLLAPKFPNRTFSFCGPPGRPLLHPCKPGPGGGKPLWMTHPIPGVFPRPRSGEGRVATNASFAA